ncbi:MAG: class I SAM-dependent methyltransferase [Fibrobacter sp.]|nr:class I SAM-dependent methyltransferase [Fibrobacter sp.]
MADFLQIFRNSAKKREMLSQVTDAYRVFNGASEGFPGVTLDRFGEKYQLQFFTAVGPSDVKAICEAVQALFQPEFLVAKWRVSPSGAALEHPRMDIIVGDETLAAGIVREGNAKFHVDLLDTVNPGLFLDMRDVRFEVEKHFANLSVNRERTVGDAIAVNAVADATVAATRFLNLFSYTCSFSVHARLGGASIATNADISGKILEKGRANYALNNLDLRPGEFFKGNAIEYVHWAEKKGLKFDGIVLDPPSFARFKGFNFNVREHLMPLVSDCARLLKPGAFLMVSSNYSEFELARFSRDVLSAVRQHCPDAKTVWSRTQGEDFPGAGTMKESSLVATWVEV